MPTRWEEFQANIRAAEGGDPLAAMRAQHALTEVIETAAEGFDLEGELEAAQAVASVYDERVRGGTKDATVLDHSRAAELHLEAGQEALVNGDPDRAKEQLAESVRRFQDAIALLPEPPIP